MKNVCCFAINISTAQLTANSLVVLSSWKKKKNVLARAWLMTGATTQSVPAGTGLVLRPLISLFPRTVIWRKNGEISLEISLFHNLNLLGLDKIFMDALDTCPPPIFSKEDLYGLTLYV